MSKLEQLIKELCSAGVEYRKIGDIADYEQPSRYIVKSTDYNDGFDVPVLTAGQTFILGYTNETTGIYKASKSHPVIIFDDFTGAFKWVDFPFKVKSSAMKMITAKQDVLIRYLFHLMGFLGYSSNEHKRLWIGIYSELEIPVPLLEIQHEVVRVLDSFTLLTAELTVELIARKKQYGFYRKTNNALVRKNENKTDGTVNGIESGTVNISLNKNEQALYSLLEKNPYYTRQELADAISKSLRTIQRTLDSLRKKDLIERVGSDKSGYWKVKNQ